MKHNISLFIFFILSLSSYAINGMLYDQLGAIEKQIFLREVRRIGKEEALHKIHNTIEIGPINGFWQSGYTLNPCFIIKLKIYSRSRDPLAPLIIRTIINKESENGYIPEPTEVEEHGGTRVTLSNNYIENYTRYWYKKNQNGAYIHLISTFNNKKSLMDVLENH